MSSRFMPPKEGAINFTTSMNLSGFLESIIIGTASTPPKCLNSRDFPSITGNPARGPISPSPSMRVASLITATVFPLFV